MGSLDGRSVRLRDVPKERRADWVTMIDGRPVRPFRFVSSASMDFIVKK